MKRWAFFIIVIFLLGSKSYAQKQGSQAMGGGLSFWSITENDTSESNLKIDGLWAHYITRDFLFEIEPNISVRFMPEKVELSGLIMGGLSKRIMDVSNIDRRKASARSRRRERTTAGIYGSISGGAWAERSDDITDKKIHLGPAVSVGLGTHSSLGSLTTIRTKFQYVYLMPSEPLHDESRTMFVVTVGFSVITKI